MGEFEKEVMNYIRREMRKGFSQDEIKRELIRVGHDIQKIETHFTHVHKHKRRKTHAFIWAVSIIILVYAALLIFEDALPQQPGKTDPTTPSAIVMTDDDYYIRALEDQNRADCDMIKDVVLKTGCYMVVKGPDEPKFDPKLQELADSPDGDLFAEAIQTSDPTKCEEIQSTALRTECLMIINPAQGSGTNNDQDPVVQPDTLTDDELLALATESKNSAYCLQIKNKQVRNECVNLIENIGGN